MSKDTSGAKPLSVYVVNYPLQYFAERIGGALVEVAFPAPADEDPAFWSPRAETISAYQQADVIFLNGAAYAKWVTKVSLPSATRVDTSTSFQDQLIRIEEQPTHTHGPEGEHVHGELAFTTWLDPMLAIEQARAVKEAIAEKIPASRALFEKQFSELEQELQDLDKQLQDLFATDVKRPVIFSHPVYQYFERRYGVDGMSVHWEPDQTPSDEMVATLKALLAIHPASYMLWEGAPRPETIVLLKGLGLESVVYDPCATAPDACDWMSVMRSNVRELRQRFEAQ